MKVLTRDEQDSLIRDLVIELHGKIDGGGKNIVSDCPYCHKKGKFGVYIGKEIGRKKKFASNCFSCGMGSREIEPLLLLLNRPDLIPDNVINIEDDIEVKQLFEDDDEMDEVNDELMIIDPPEGYERTNEADYLEERGYEDIDYEVFEAGLSDYFKFTGYVIFPIYDDGDLVGYVARHEWSKHKLEKYNRNAKAQGLFQIQRYRNSTDNDFVKLLYNIDSVIQDVTRTVIIVEGIFDVIALYRLLNLYNNKNVAVVATFGKKISDVQMWKLQQKGVENIIVGYDPDAVNTIKDVSVKLDKYFNCFIADIQDQDKDFDDCTFWEVFDVFTQHLQTPREYNMDKVPQKPLQI